MPGKPKYWKLPTSHFSKDVTPPEADHVRMFMVEVPYFQPYDADGSPCGDPVNDGFPCPGPGCP